MNLARNLLVAIKQSGSNAASEDATNTARLAHSICRTSNEEVQDTLASGDFAHGDES